MIPSGARVLVVGAGIVGCAVAYFLARRGCQVVVLDEHGDEIAHAPAVEPMQFLVDDLLDPSPIDGGEAFGQPVGRVFDGDALVAGGGSRRLFAHARSVRPRRGRRKGLPGPSASAVVGCG